MPQITNIQNNPRLAVYNSCRPPEGSLEIPLTVPFTPANQTWTADLSQLQTNAQISYVQSAFVDNSNNSVALTLQGKGSGQPIRVPAGWAGWVALLAPNPPSIDFTSLVAANLNVQVVLTNFPVNTFLWPANPSLAPLPVTDLILDALLAGGFLPVQDKVIGNLDTLIPLVTGSRTLSGVITAAGPTTLLTPVNFYRITGLTLMLSDNVAQAVAGIDLITLLENATQFAQFNPYIPAAPVVANAPVHPIIDRPYDYWSRVSGQTLRIQLGAALTSGNLSYNINYLETTQIGP